MKWHLEPKVSKSAIADLIPLLAAELWYVYVDHRIYVHRYPAMGWPRCRCGDFLKAKRFDLCGTTRVVSGWGWSKQISSFLGWPSFDSFIIKHAHWKLFISWTSVGLRYFKVQICHIPQPPRLILLFSSSSVTHPTHPVWNIMSGWSLSPAFLFSFWKFA